MAKKKSALGKKAVAKKKVAVKKKKVGQKTTAKKKVAKKRGAAAKKKSGRAAARKKTVRKKAAVKKPAGRRTSGSIKKKKVKRAKSLGRPRLPGDAKLDLVFQKDYQAREIFAFLGVETVKELETFAPDEIIEKLAGPLVQTVGRIRKALAINNRCLADDLKFALDFQEGLKGN